MGPNDPDRATTLLVTDIQGSTPLWEALGLEFRASLDLHDAVVRAALVGGRELRTEGDAFVVAFGSPADALRAAAHIQAELAAAPWPEALRAALPPGPIPGLRIRIGVVSGSAGEAELVRRATRVAAAAHGGQILADAATASAAPELAATPLGDFVLDGEVASLVQVASPALASREFPAPRAVQRRSTNLPAATTRTIGRGAEVVALDSTVREARWVTLTGLAGVGKTHLALAWAAAQRREGGTWCVDLAGASDGGAIARAVVEALGIGGTRSEDLGRALAGRGPTLIVLDGAEHARDAVRDLVTAWLAQAPALEVVVTSQAPLGGAERVVAVAPLGTAASPDGESPAVALFLDRARAVAPRLDLTDQLGAVRALVERLDGLPLALELAAARVPVLSPTQLVARLDRRLDLLRVEAAGRPARQRSLAAALDASRELLTDAERSALAGASVFRGSFDADAARAVLGLDDLAPLEALTRWNLLVRDPGGRWRWFESVQVWASRWAGDLAALEERHLAWYARLGSEAAIGQLEGGDYFARQRACAVDVPNLRIASIRALELRDPRAADLVVGLMHFADPYSGRAESIRLVDRALALPWAARDRARLLERRAWLANTTEGRHSGEPVALAVAVARETGDPRLVARALLQRALWRRRARDAKGALSDAVEGLALEVGGAWLVAQLGAAGAAAAFGVGDWEDALRRYEVAAAGALRSGDVACWAESWSNVGVIRVMQGQPRDALDHLGAALTVARERGLVELEASISGALANALALAGRPEAAVRTAQDARALCVLRGQRRGEGVVLSAVAAAELADGRVDRAEATTQQALAIHREAGNGPFVADALTVLASIALERGRTAPALEMAREALEQARAFEDQQVEAGARLLLFELGAVDATEAEAAAGQLAGLDAGPDEVVGWCRIARGHAASGRLEPAREALGRAEALAATVGIPPRTVAGRELARTRDRVPGVSPGARPAGGPAAGG